MVLVAEPAINMSTCSSFDVGVGMATAFRRAVSLKHSSRWWRAVCLFGVDIHRASLWLLPPFVFEFGTVVRLKHEAVRFATVRLS